VEQIQPGFHEKQAQELKAAQIKRAAELGMKGMKAPAHTEGHGAHEVHGAPESHASAPVHGGH